MRFELNAPLSGRKLSHVTNQVITLVGIDQEFEIPPHSANHEVSGKVRWLPKGGRVLGVAPTCMCVASRLS